jgi:hypothetical protein
MNPAFEIRRVQRSRFSKAVQLNAHMGSRVANGSVPAMKRSIRPSEEILPIRRIGMSTVVLPPVIHIPLVAARSRTERLDAELDHHLRVILGGGRTGVWLCAAPADAAPRIRSERARRIVNTKLEACSGQHMTH